MIGEAAPFVAAWKTISIALAMGLDVMALSTNIGVMGVRFRVGSAFVAAKMLMEVVGHLGL